MNGPASSLLVVECLFLCSGGLWSLKLWPEGKCNLHRKKRERDANFSRPKARTAYRPLYVCMGRCLACAGTKTNTGLSELVGALGLCFVFGHRGGSCRPYLCFSSSGSGSAPAQQVRHELGESLLMVSTYSC